MRGTHTEIYITLKTKSDIQKRQTDRQTTGTHSQTDRHTDRQTTGTHRQTDRQTDVLLKHQKYSESLQ